MNLAHISVVIIGFNEEVFLDKCIDSVNDMFKNTPFLSEYEIMYVDSRSNDKSVEIALNKKCVVFILEGDRSAAAGRQVGIIESKYDTILFLDGDMEINKNFINEVYNSNLYLEKNVAGFIGLRDDFIYKKNTLEEPVGHILNFYNNKKVSEVRHMGGASLLCKGKLLDSGGFEPEQKMSEEPLVLINLLSKGYRVINIQKPFITHHNDGLVSYTDKIKKMIATDGASYYFGMLFYKTVTRKKLYAFLKVFPYTCLAWIFDLFLIISLFCSFFIIPLVFLFVYLFLTKPKILVTSQFRLLGILYYLMKRVLSFDFRYRKVI